MGIHDFTVGDEVRLDTGEYGVIMGVDVGCNSVIVGIRLDNTASAIIYCQSDEISELVRHHTNDSPSDYWGNLEYIEFTADDYERFKDAPVITDEDIKRQMKELAFL